MDSKGEMKALILIGGKSSRMGTDKHLLEINGKPQYLHLAEMLKDCGLDVYLSCKPEQIPNLTDDLKKIEDQYGDIGPIGGVASAFTDFPKSSWLVVACDLVNLNRTTIENLIESQDRSYDVVTYRLSDSPFPETTMTIYNPQSYDLVKAAISSKDYSLQEILRKLSIKTIIPVDKETLKNANSKRDLDN